MLRGNEGQHAARLEILAPIGRGGFGRVFEALDARSGQRVAVKELADSSADSIARFKQEFRALAGYHHPNLVALRELIEQDGRWLIVMELVPGTDLLEYVRGADNDNAQGPDEKRLRTALTGVVQGLSALHGYGVVHRDLKPSNVRVRPDGRAVLLDFGLATSVDPSKQSTHVAGVGTVMYMAPEQSGGVALGPAADMYALGVCLFEALTGRVPFDGNNAIRVLLDKQQKPAPRVRTLTPAAPADLDDLCARLLAIDPEARPSADEVLAILKGEPAFRGSLPTQAAAAANFAGRESELDHLTRALSATNEGEQRVVLIEGESGIGKSELVSEFLRRASASDPRLVALRGRCYENEQVSYKAFDGCVDELARLLRRLPEAECRALLPERAALLGQLFPVLRNVQAIAKAPREGSPADPTARRLEAFAALSQLLARLAEERPLVLVLDDLQWADAESFRLLNALHEQPTRAPLLLLITVRPRDELEADVLGHMEELRRWRQTSTIGLLGLPPEQTRALAARLLGGEAPARVLDAIAKESEGHPLFVGELVQYSETHDRRATAKLTIDLALRARVEALEPEACELLELVALAARPYPATLFAAALGCAQIEEQARPLLTTKLLRQRRGHELGTFHDRIRHASVSLIARARLPVLHHKLAAALDTLPGADPSEQARHWEAAGEPERASAAYEQAGHKALAALAFTRAAELFARAIALLAESDVERQRSLSALRADALAWAGRSAEAAQLYALAAHGAEGEARLRLRTAHAFHLVLSGSVTAGFQACAQIVREVGLSPPRTRLGFVLRYVWHSLLAALAGSRDARPLSDGELRKLAVLRTVNHAMGVLHPEAYVLFSLWYLRLVTRSGEPLDLAFASASRAWFSAIQSSPRAAERFLRDAERLTADRTPSAALADALHKLGSARIACLDWKGAAADLERAESMAQEHHRNDPWFITMVRYQLGAAWYRIGEYARHTEATERWIAEARERNDMVTLSLLSGMGHGFARHLLRDQPEAALHELAEGAALPPEPYGFAHLGQLIGNVQTLLYRGGLDALSYITEHEARHGRSFLLRSVTGQQTVHLYRMNALLSAAAATRSGAERVKLLRQARASAQRAKKAPTPYGKYLAALALAQLDAESGQRESALMHARVAASGFGELRSSALLPFALYVTSVLERPEGALRARALLFDQLRDIGWSKPERALSASVPLHESLVVLGARVSNKRPARLLRDRYEVVDTLGQGGFGKVVVARDAQTGAKVALKELVRSGGFSLERFKREFRALADIHHENLMQLFELFEHEGSWYIAMELIEGSDFASYVRPEGSLDVERLRGAVLGVARALAALHGRGFVHRDVKPENVLVTASGRAVLLDYGLIARSGDASENGGVGSADYGAPEQLQGAPPHGSADVYALGSSIRRVLAARRAGRALVAQPRTRDSELPLATLPPEARELALLSTLMRAARPEARPSIDEVLKTLEGEGPRGASSQEHEPSRVSPDEGAEELVFAGRVEERALLQESLAAARAGALTIALVEGESGVGKSALARDFALRVRGTSTRTLVLSSRCYENEQVAFKAFDGAIDQLARHLRELPQAACAALLPKRSALLAQLFPVLEGVPAIASAGKKGLPADPAARKRTAIECLLELLGRVAAERTLLFVIDDLQWADQESYDLIHLLAAHAARVPAMILATVRPENELAASARESLAALHRLSACKRIPLGGLPPQAVHELASQLLGEELDSARLVALTRESKGHPLFLRELIAHEKGGTSLTGTEHTLEAALGARIAALPQPARELLALVALGDKPHPAHVYAKALGQSELPRELTITLLNQGLLRRRGERLSCYHDQIRRVALMQHTEQALSDAARGLAQALSAASHEKTDAAERARLWELAARPAEASAAYESAGDQCLEALAFARAEEHYARALSLLGESHDARWQRVMVARGHALVRSGHSALAARCYQSAAQHVGGDEQVQLRTLAAQHLMQGAQVVEGMRATEQLLAQVGIALPRTEQAAKKRIVWERASLALRALKPRRSVLSAEESRALDTLYGLGAAVRAVAYLPGTALMAQYVRRAFDASDPRHAARALAYEALWRSASRAGGDHEELSQRSEAIALRTHDPAVLAEVVLFHGVTLLMQNQYAAAGARLARAHAILIAECPGNPWLVTAARTYLGTAWMARGLYGELCQHADAWMSEAYARDDRYAVAALAGMGGCALRHTLKGDAEAGVAELQAALAPWPKEPWAGIHMGALITTRQLLASMGDGQRYARYMDEMAPVVERSFLMRSAGARVNWLPFVSQSRLHSITAPDAAEAALLLQQARVPLQQAARSKDGIMRVLRQSTEACILLLQGDKRGALEVVRSALQDGHEHYGRDGFGMPPLHYVHGALVGGAEGRAECREVKAQLAAEGWSDWRNGLNMRMPVQLALLDQLVDVRSTEL